MTKLYILAGAALLAVGLLASTPNTAQAGKGGGGHGFGHAGFHQPPGWSRGRKVGWRGGHLPPGLAKKGFR